MTRLHFFPDSERRASETSDCSEPSHSLLALWNDDLYCPRQHHQLEAARHRHEGHHRPLCTKCREPIPLATGNFLSKWISTIELEAFPPFDQPLVASRALDGKVLACQLGRSSEKHGCAVGRRALSPSMLRLGRGPCTAGPPTWQRVQAVSWEIPVARHGWDLARMGFSLKFGRQAPFMCGTLVPCPSPDSDAS